MNSRSGIVKKNIIYSFLLKMLGMGLSFILLPLTVHYLNEVEYGVWITLFTIMSWINWLDMGLGLGLRYKLSEAVSENNIENIRMYLSTGIVAMISIGVILLVIFLIGINFIKLQVIFNTIDISEYELYVSTLLAGFFIILSFILSIINQIYYAYQKSSITGVIQVVHSLIMLICVYYLTQQSNHELFYFILSFGIALIFSRIIFIYIFFLKNKQIIPSLKYVKIASLKDICNLGIKFFIIQITCIILCSSSNILITQCLGPEYVREYDIVFKIFSIITMAYGLISAPLWTAYTDAYVKKDFKWIKKIIKKLLYSILIVICISFLLAWKIEYIVNFWFGEGYIIIPKYLGISIACLVIANCWTNIWATFVNGIGKINIQVYSNLISAITIIPLAYFFMSKLGTAGMAIAISIGWLISGIPILIQVKIFLKDK